jgi:hypothetical protein
MMLVELNVAGSNGVASLLLLSLPAANELRMPFAPAVSMAALSAAADGGRGMPGGTPRYPPQLLLDTRMFWPRCLSAVM